MINLYAKFLLKISLDHYCFLHLVLQTNFKALVATWVPEKLKINNSHLIFGILDGRDHLQEAIIHCRT